MIRNHENDFLYSGTFQHTCFVETVLFIPLEGQKGKKSSSSSDSSSDSEHDEAKQNNKTAVVQTPMVLKRKKESSTSSDSSDKSSSGINYNFYFRSPVSFIYRKIDSLKHAFS